MVRSLIQHSSVCGPRRWMEIGWLCVSHYQHYPSKKKKWITVYDSYHYFLQSEGKVKEILHSVQCLTPSSDDYAKRWLKQQNLPYTDHVDLGSTVCGTSAFACQAFKWNE